MVPVVSIVAMVDFDILFSSRGMFIKCLAGFKLQTFILSTDEETANFEVELIEI
jgi:hypothetical protein